MIRRSRPGDWRNDPSYSYFTALVAEEDAEAALEAAPGDPSLEEQAARYREEAAYYKAVLEQKDWKGYLHMQIERLKKGEAIDGSQSAETQKERDVQIEILQMQIDLGIEPGFLTEQLLLLRGRGGTVRRVEAFGAECAANQ